MTAPAAGSPASVSRDHGDDASSWGSGMGGRVLVPGPGGAAGRSEASEGQPAPSPLDLPLAATLFRTASAVTNPVIVVLEAGSVSDPAEGGPAAAVIESTPGVAAVVPVVLGRDGSLAEAGAVVEGGNRLRSRGAGESRDQSEHRFRRTVDGTRFGCFAVRRSLVSGLAIDPEVDDPRVLAAEVLEQVRAAGHLVVLDPAWTVTVAGGDCPRPLEAAAHASSHRQDRSAAGERILVVCADLSGRPTPWSDGGVNDLLDLVEEVCPTAAVTVACSEVLGNESVAAGLRARGIEVQTGPTDWTAWFARRAYQFSHLIVTDGGLSSGLAPVALDTQPQAASVLWTHSLPFRVVESLMELTPPWERAGHQHVRAEVMSFTARVVGRFERVWSASPLDQQYLAGLRDEVVPLVSTIVPPWHGADLGFADRFGLAVLATPGADLVSAHEDAAVAAVEEVFTHLVGRDPSLRLAVVADRPTPRLARLGELPGVTLVAPGPDGGIEVFRQARVVVAPYRHGLGGAAALWAALAASTPVLTTARGAEHFVLGDLAGTAVVPDPLDMVEPAWRLHQDRGEWSKFRAALGAMASRHHGPAAFDTIVRAGLRELGVLPRPATATAARTQRSAKGGAVSGVDATPGRLPRAPWRPTRPRLRPADRPGRVPARIPEGIDEVAGYRLWCATRGPSPAVLADLAAEMDRLAYRPRISVITPVYNTDADVLEAAIASVQNQVYDNWELCLADDGSTRAETKRVLARAIADHRVRLVSLPGQSGISGASNAAAALASGEFVTFLDHDDVLKPHALAQVARWLDADPDLDLLYSDEDKLDMAGGLCSPFFKPDWSPNLLSATNYVCHLMVVRKSLMDKVGGFRSGFDGSQDHDLVLRLTEATDRISHIPEPLYSWRMVPGSAAAVADAKPYAFEAAKKALAESLVRQGRQGTVVDGAVTGVYRVRHGVAGRPKVAIIIPSRDRVDLLRRCIQNIRQKSSYTNYEIVVIDNESRDPATLEYLACGPDRVVRYPFAFNYARMLNLAAQVVDCESLLFLNNDTEVIDGDWIEALLEHSTRPEVGAVGCRLYLPDGKPQHEGIIAGAMGTATNVDHAGFWGLGEMTRDCTAITGACTMIRPSVYWAVGGNDERLRVAYNDVDICLRIHQAGYQVVYTPYARLVHVEGASRAGYEHSEDASWFRTRWRQDEDADPYYNPNFDRHRLFRLAL